MKRSREKSKINYFLTIERSSCLTPEDANQENSVGEALEQEDKSHTDDYIFKKSLVQ